MTTPWQAFSLLSVAFLAVTSGQRCNDRAHVVRANSNFAIDMYQRIGLGTSGANMIFSPFSVSTALAMTYGGANGATATQMAQALRFNGIPAYCSVHRGFRALMTLLQNANNDYTLSTANKIYLDTSFNLQWSFYHLTQTYYQAPAEVLDILHHAAASTDTINDWVADHTDDQITDFLDELDPDTKLVLVNAITFAGKWLKPFGNSSSNGPFHLSNSATIQTCKMQMACGPATRKYATIPSLNAKMIELPYEGEDVSMFILRPNQIEGLAYLEANLDLTTLNAAIASMTTRTVNLILPKFSLDQNVDLKGYLQAMGMTSVFTPWANLSGIGTGGALYVDFVVHQAIIKVDEQGTEASGATGVGVCYVRRRRSIRNSIVQFDVDRPFLYIIMEKTSGSILFMGRVTHPQTSCPSGIRREAVSGFRRA